MRVGDWGSVIIGDLEYCYESHWRGELTEGIARETKQGSGHQGPYKALKVLIRPVRAL